LAWGEIEQTILTNQCHAHEEIYPIAKCQRRGVADPDRQALCQPEGLVNLVFELQLPHRMHRVGHHSRKLGRIMMSVSLRRVAGSGQEDARGEWKMAVGFDGEMMIYPHRRAVCYIARRMPTSIGLFCWGGRGRVEGWRGEEEEKIRGCMS